MSIAENYIVMKWFSDTWTAQVSSKKPHFWLFLLILALEVKSNDIWFADWGNMILLVDSYKFNLL
jgi:hypothetical protein